jgi:hypothetical protein
LSGTLAPPVVVDLIGRIVVLAVLRVVDEDGSTIGLSAEPTLSEPRVLVLVKDGGLLVLMADPTAAPPLPASFALTLAEPGFRPATVAVALPANAVFPLHLPDLMLRRVPVSLGGRVVAAATGTPVAGAAITLAPLAAVGGQTLIALGQALGGDVAPGTPVAAFALNPVGGPVPIKTVQATALDGETALLLDDRHTLAAGQLLRIGPPPRRSLARISFVDPTPPLTAPGLVLLSPPLVATARQGDPAEPCTLGAAGPAGNTIGEAFAGEALVLADAAVIGDALLVGGAPYTAARTTDADGYYQRIGIARFRRLTVSIAAAGFANQSRAWSPGGIPRLDFRLVP